MDGILFGIMIGLLVGIMIGGDKERLSRRHGSVTPTCSKVIFNSDGGGPK